MLSRFKRSGLVEDNMLYCAQRKEYKYIIQTTQEIKCELGKVVVLGLTPKLDLFSECWQSSLFQIFFFSNIL